MGEWSQEEKDFGLKHCQHTWKPRLHVFLSFVKSQEPFPFPFGLEEGERIQPGNIDHVGSLCCNTGALRDTLQGRALGDCKSSDQS